MLPLLLKKITVFEDVVIKKKDLHQCRIIPFEKRPICKNPVCVSVNHDVANRLYFIDMYDNGQEMCYL